MVEVKEYIKTELSMKVVLKKVYMMVMANLQINMETYMKDNSKMDYLMVKENLLEMMVNIMQEIGFKVNIMERENYYFQMEKNILDNLNKIIDMDMEN